MPALSIALGTIYIFLGVFSYLTSSPDSQSVTALIPAFVGIPLIILGLLGRNERMLKTTMHIAAILALISFIFPLFRAIPSLSEKGLTKPVSAQLIMAGLALIFLIFAVKSFIDARRNKQV